VTASPTRNSSTSTTRSTSTTDQQPIRQQRTTAVTYASETLVRTEQTQRLQQAASLRRGHQLALARRKTRRAERAALQARLVLSRTL
jgi:hypothetical protein